VLHREQRASVQEQEVALITEAELIEMPRIQLRKQAIAAGMEVVASATAPKEELVKFVLDSQGDSGESSGRAKKSVRGKKAAPPEPLSDEEKGAADGVAEERRSPGRPKKATEEDSKASDDKGLMKDLLNRVDTIGTVLDNMRKNQEADSAEIEKMAAAISAMELQLADIHKATFWVYNGAFDVAKNYDEIEDAPEAE